MKTELNLTQHKHELSVILLLVTFILIHWLVPDYMEISGLIVLSAGLIFPGIPHGALDHILSQGKKIKGFALVKFIIYYLIIMASIVALWLLSPTIGLMLFLLYSAWHFGETDTRNFGFYTPFNAIAYGIAILLFLLGTHPLESQYYFELIGAKEINIYWNTYFPLAILLSFVLLLKIATHTLQRKLTWTLNILILAGIAYIPLIPAFTIYFLGIHSVRAWNHMRTGLNMSTRELIIKALPFSLGAYCLFIIMALYLPLSTYAIENWTGTLFIFLAAISAPHIVMMHRFYLWSGIRPN
jgi:Brp/Blh family beta-carotene 15,15'-monooxygenase